MTTELPTKTFSLSDFYNKIGVREETVPEGVSLQFRSAGQQPYIDVVSPGGITTICGRTTGQRTERAVFGEIREALAELGAQTFDTTHPVKAGLVSTQGSNGFTPR